jgi:hypothetical protein
MVSVTHVGMIYGAALLLFVTGVLHSYLGERYILIRLFKRDNLPALFGGTVFTAGTLRFAWHLTTVAWWGLGYLLLVIAGPGLEARHALNAIAVIALVSGIFPLVLTKGRHLSWVVFFTVASLLFAAAGG